MATQITISEQPLNVVLRPDSPAEAAYRSAVLAPGFQPDPGSHSSTSAAGRCRS